MSPTRLLGWRGATPALALRLAAIVAFVLLAACSGSTTPTTNASPTPQVSPKPTAAEYFIHGHGTKGQPVKVQDVVKGSPVYVLKATDVYYSTSSAKGRFLNDLIYFYKGNTVRLTLASPTADVNRVTYDFVLSGGVKAHSALGITMYCDSMSYDGITKLLTATGAVRAIDAQGDVVTGDKAVADLDLQELHMSGHVGIGR